MAAQALSNHIVGEIVGSFSYVGLIALLLSWDVLSLLISIGVVVVQLLVVCVLSFLRV